MTLRNYQFPISWMQKSDINGAILGTSKATSVVALLEILASSGWKLWFLIMKGYISQGIWSLVVTNGR